MFDSMTTNELILSSNIKSQAIDNLSLTINGIYPVDWSEQLGTPYISFLNDDIIFDETGYYIIQVILEQVSPASLNILDAYAIQMTGAAVRSKNFVSISSNLPIDPSLTVVDHFNLGDIATVNINKQFVSVIQPDIKVICNVFKIG